MGATPLLSRGPILSLLAVGLLASQTAGCDFPVPSKKYSLSQGGGPSAIESEDPSVQRVLGAFAGTDEFCAEALVDECTTPLFNCSTSPDCVDFAECVRQRANPAAETTCTDDLGTPLADHWAFEHLRHCFSTRYAECSMGDDFRCVGKYGPPSSDRSEVTVGQQLRLLNGLFETSAIGAQFTVSFCPHLTDCMDPDLTVAPGEDGIYNVTLTVADANFGPGNDWLGYRIIDGPEIYSSIVDANIPVWGRRLEITRLMSRSTIEYLNDNSDVAVEDGVYVQVVDCKSDPAPGVFFETPDSETATIGYVTERSTDPEGPTFHTGAIGIHGHEPNRLQRVHARWNGKVIASYQGSFAPGRPHYIRLHPDGAK